jgi:hypothetical protein
MADYDERKRTLTIKLVYYGPALSGKTTNLMRLHDLIQPQLIGDLMVMETQGDRTLFFDLMPLGFVAPSGLKIKFKLFTVPGQVQHDSTRKAVLSRADGVVFVADSQNSQSVNNAESFQNLSENCGRVGLDFKHLPLVVQYNKCDLADIVSAEEVTERWAAAPWPVLFSVALSGQGVRETFHELLKQVYHCLEGPYRLAGDHGLAEADFVSGALGVRKEGEEAHGG